MERTPVRLLKEIILVDDHNDDETIGAELKVLDKVKIYFFGFIKFLRFYINQYLAKVKVLRNNQREGLIRSRIKGTQASSGEVLIFLDSHCEVRS